MGVVEVSANARDAGSGLALVRFEFSAGDDEWSEVGTVTAAPYRTSWNTGVLGEGDYRLRAIALDRAGNEAVRSRSRSASSASSLRSSSRSRRVPLAEGAAEGAPSATRSKTAGVEFQIAVADTFAWQALGAVAQPPFELESTRLASRTARTTCARSPATGRAESTPRGSSAPAGSTTSRRAPRSTSPPPAPCCAARCR